MILSSLEDMTGRERTDVLPGLTLSEPRLMEFGVAESEFARQHLLDADFATMGVSDEIRERVIERALADVKRGEFDYCSKGFDEKAIAAKNFPLLLWLSLRVKHNEIQRKQAEAYINAGNQANLSREVLKLWGYGNSAKKATAPPTTSASSGGVSSESSASAA